MLFRSVFSLTLPHTPPKKTEGDPSFAWQKAFKLLSHPVILVLWLVTFVDAFVHNSYFIHTGTFLQSIGIKANWVMPVMSFGQIMEIPTMLALGYFLKRFGWKTTMILGVLGHAVRFGVYALFPNQTLVILVQLVHGVCYAFFFATVYIFVDEYFPKDVRTSAQGLFNLMILGVGDLAAKIFWPQVQRIESLGLMKLDDAGKSIPNYSKIFLIPCGMAILAALILLVGFHPKKTEVGVAGENVPRH